MFYSPMSVIFFNPFDGGSYVLFSNDFKIVFLSVYGLTPYTRGMLFVI